MVGSSSAGVSAQSADFRCPAAGTELTDRGSDTSSVRVASGQESNACLVKSQSGDRSETVRPHWGLIGSVDAAGESYAAGLDLEPLWPLKAPGRSFSTL